MERWKVVDCNQRAHAGIKMHLQLSQQPIQLLAIHPRRIDHACDAATGVPLDLRHALAKQGRLSKPVGRYHNGRTDLVRAQLNVPQDASTALLSVGTDAPSWAPPVSPSGAFCSVSTKSHVFTCAISALLFPIPLVYNGTKRRWHNVRYMSDRLALRQMRVRFSAIPGQPPVLHELWLYFYLCAYFLHFISL